MGKTYYTKVIVAVVCLIAVAIILNSPVAENSETKNNAIGLANALERFDGWEKLRDIQLDEKIVEALKLDDFVFREYVKENDRIVLYIGYYHSVQKVGAAHDPLVCFPGQGWSLSEKNEQSLTVQTKQGKDKQINYNTMIGELSGERELIVYWFQSFDKTAHSTLFQKVQLLWGRIVSDNEDNAFVRISININKTITPDEAMARAKTFMRHFYPHFINYINTRTT